MPYVMQMQVIDENSFWAKRTIFLNMNEPTFMKGLKKIREDKTIVNTYSTVRGVLNA